MDRLSVDQLVLEAPVAGERRVASVDAAVAIADGRARVKADAGTVAVAGGPGGDRLALLLDARPDDDVFDLQAQLRAPADGVVANLAGLTEPLAAQITGKGTWSNGGTGGWWRGWAATSWPACACAGATAPSGWRARCGPT